MKKKGYHALRFCICFSTIFFISCGTHHNTDEIKLTGTLINATGKKIMLSELLPAGTVMLDSSVLSSEGAFAFRFKPDSAGFYLLRIPGNRKILLVSERGEMISITADLNINPFTYSIVGSPGSSLLRDFLFYSEKNLAKADSLTGILRQNQDNPEFYGMTRDFDPLFKNIIDDQKKFERRFILANKYSMASLIVLNYKLGLKPVLTLESEPELFLMLDSTLSSRYPQNKHVLFHHQRVMEFKRESQ